MQDNVQYNPYGSVQMPPEYLRVGFGMRLLAWIVDWIVIIIISVIATILLIKYNVEVPTADAESTAFLQNMYRFAGISVDEAAMYANGVAAYKYALLLIAFGYSLISAMFGASPGKMIFGLTIAHADGKRGSMQLWIRRWAVRDASIYLRVLALLPTLSFVGVFAFIIGLVITVGCFMAASASRLALHDRIAQTAIFRRSDVQ